jgi:cytochrome P450
METGRLSPPVVGVMRRAEKDIVLNTDEEPPDTLIPQVWDVWLYFAAAGRDPDAYSAANQFVAARYMAKYTDDELGFEFGWGPKSCLGGPLMQSVIRTVLDVCIEINLKIKADVNQKAFEVGLDGKTYYQRIGQEI